MIDVSDDLDFCANSDYQIENLSFQFCGQIERSNWVENSTELQKILSAINNSNLISSLKKIGLYHDFIPKGSYLNTFCGVSKVAQDVGINAAVILYEKIHPNLGHEQNMDFDQL